MRSVACLCPLLLTVLPLAGLVACGGEPSTLGSQRRAIVNGEQTAGYPAVVMIQRTRGICTATLIGKQTLLTAAHCVPPGEVPQVLIDGQDWPIEHTRANTGFDMGLFHDVGVIRLASPPPIPPVRLATAPPAEGQEVTLVGYGSGGAAGIGTKHEGNNTVSQVTNALVVIAGSADGAANTCLGDSGGPVFATLGGREVQVGIHSTMIGPCGQQSQSTRVDAYLDWILEAADGDVAPRDEPPPGVVATVAHEALDPRLPLPSSSPGPSPAPAEPEADGAGGCRLAAGAGAAPLWLVPLALLWLRRRGRRRQPIALSGGGEAAAPPPARAGAARAAWAGRRGPGSRRR